MDIQFNQHEDQMKLMISHFQKELQKIQNYKNSFLVVSHGIFSKGFSELSKYFEGIYCTNSYSDNFMPGLKNKNGDLLLKQLYVF